MYGKGGCLEVPYSCHFKQPKSAAQNIYYKYILIMF